MSVLVEARSISRRGRERWLLREQSLTIAAGERIALSGPSGAGKTVLLRALALLDPLDAGEIRFADREVTPLATPDYRCQVGYLHQTPALADGSVEDNLRLPYSLARHRHRTYDRRRAIQLLERLGKDEHLLGRTRGELSGGEAQLVALARRLLLEPVVLLLDEPTAALDPASAQLARTLLDDWQAAEGGRRAYLWVTHEARLGERVADRRLQLMDGLLEETE